MAKLDFYPEEWESFLSNCDFTDSEVEIIKLTRRGWAIADIAAELYLSESTVKRRRKSIDRKILHYIVTKK